MAPLLPDGPIDTLGVLDAVLRLPELLADAADAGPVPGLPGATSIDSVVVAAGSTVATAGELVEALAGPVSSLPVLAHADAVLPAHVSTRSLVVVLAGDDDRWAAGVVAEASGRGAQVVLVGPSGAGLLDEAPAGAVVVPADLDVPVARVAVGPLAVHGLSVLEQLGVFAEVAPMVAAAVEQLGRRRTALADGGPAARLAHRIGRTLPIVHAADAVGGVAALRWKRQFNLAAKVTSFAGALPAIGWEDVAGWGQHGDMTRQVFSLVTLRHDHEPPGTADRMRVLDDLLDEVVHERHDVRAEGDGALAQVMDLVFFGDVTAWHLAQQLEIDPGPTAAVSTVWSTP